ncbi:MAG: TonB-dependent receptor [Pseudomonadota bacterium]
MKVLWYPFIRGALVYFIVQPVVYGQPADDVEEPEEEVEEIVVTSTRSRQSLADMPTRVEVITGEELGEKANMKPGDIRMLLNESTGIQVQQTSATTFNSSIRIQGLDGRYTQMLRDGMPLYSGFAGGLGLLQVAPLDLQSVEVIKGSVSTLYGGGAIAGLVNLNTKVPTSEPETSLLFNRTSAGGLDASAFSAARNEEIGGTLFASWNESTAYDPANIGLSAIPEFERWTINPRAFLYFDDESELRAGITAVVEDRLGGNMDYIKDRPVSNPYYENNRTERLSSQLEYTREFGIGTLNLRNSLGHFDREISVPGFMFAGVQESSFSELHYLLPFDTSEWVMGMSLITEKFRQRDAAPGFRHDYSQRTLGAFVQNSRELTETMSLEAGLRVDRHSEQGTLALPRLSLLYEPRENITLRAGGGLGYRSPTLFSEDAESLQFRNILPQDRNSTTAERSRGLNMDLNYRHPLANGEMLTLNTLVFYTRVDDPQVLLPQRENFVFSQPQGYVDTRGAEINLTLTHGDFKLYLGYTHANVREHYAGAATEATLVSEHRLNSVLMYEREDDFRVGLEAYYYSPQLLGDGATGDSYWVTGLMTEKVFMEGVSLFLNFENISDTRQTRFDTIYTGSLSDPQFRDIYAPLDGFVVNGGIKIKFN